MSVEDSLSGKECVKCSLPALYTGVDPKKAWYCQECFVQVARNKFRSSLSKRNVYKNKDEGGTLVVYDGSPSASYLLHQINDALRQTNFKRLMIRPTIVVLVSVLGKEHIEEVVAKTEHLKQILPDFIQWITVHVAFGMPGTMPSNSSESNCFLGIDEISEYCDLISTVSSETYREELRRLLKERCLRKLANWTKMKKVMLPDDADDLGKLALSQLCLGRGGAVSSITNVVDKRESLSFIRPLRDISKKEIGIINHILGYDNDCIQFSPKDKRNSMQKVTSDFVDNLVNEGFKSTINTVLSTAGKIHNTNTGKADKCVLCEVMPRQESTLCFICSHIESQCDHWSFKELLTS